MGKYLNALSQPAKLAKRELKGDLFLQLSCYDLCHYSLHYGFHVNS